MSQLENQVIQLRREMELLKSNQVVIYDTQPRSPTTQSIWRQGSSLSTWNGKNWIDTTGGGEITDFANSVFFSSSAYNSVSWSAGAIQIGTSTGVATHSISSGSFTMSVPTFFYWSPSNPNSIQTTTTPATAVTSGGLILAVGQVNSDPTIPTASIKTFGNNQNDLITADQIVANGITANKLASQLIYAGSLIINTGGLIRGGQTGFNTGVGFFLGYSGGAYKLSIGNSTDKYLTYDGTDLILSGGIIRTKASGDRVEIENNYLKTFGSLGNITIRGDTTGIDFYHAGTTVTGTLNYSSTNIPGIGNITGFKLNQQLSCTGAIRSQLGFGGPTLQLTHSSGFAELSGYSNDTIRFTGSNIWMAGGTWSINGYSGLGGVLYSDGSHLYFNGNFII